MLSNERRAVERLIFRTLAVVVILFAAAWLLPHIWDKLSPFIVAVPLAAMLQPVVRFCHKRMKMKRSLASLILVILLILALIGVMIWFVGLLVRMVNPFLDQSGDIVTATVSSVRQAMDSLMKYTADNFSPEVQQQISKSINDMIGDITKWGTNAATKIGGYIISLATRLPYMIIYVSFLAMALYFITRDYPEIRSYLPGGVRRDQSSSTTRLTNSAIRSLVGYLKVQGTFSLMVFFVSLIALNIFGFSYAGAIAIIAGIMEFIPMIGSGLLYILMGIVFLLSGNVTAGIQVLLLTGFLQLLRRVLEPKLMSNSIGITPLQSLIGMFAGLRFGGILGLIGGPVLMSVLVGAFHSKLFESFISDIRCIAAYLRSRWKTPDPPQAGPPDSSGDPLKA